MFERILDPISSIFFPQECNTCGGPSNESAVGVSCRECWNDTPLFSGSEILCRRCGALLGASGGPRDVSCHKCDEHFYEHAFAVGPYVKALASEIVHLKTTPNISKYLAVQIRKSLDRHELRKIDLVVPVPLSKERAVERGFNQAAVVAEVVGKYLDRKVDAFSVERTKHTPIHRMSMDRRARELTVEKAFSVTRPKLIAGKSILLVDDVLTSGSTVSACAKALLKNGAANVIVFTLARAVLK
ncbi:MAG TPA: ComF family protein [Pyrinomonadaceae bacterium]|nr:ComF family protein [Pyrinomonadaceae bacterium]